VHCTMWVQTVVLLVCQKHGALQTRFTPQPVGTTCMNCPADLLLCFPWLLCYVVLHPRALNRVVDKPAYQEYTCCCEVVTHLNDQVAAV
jgi:hypothetical protein